MSHVHCVFVRNEKTYFNNSTQYLFCQNRFRTNRFYEFDCFDNNKLTLYFFFCYGSTVEHICFFYKGCHDFMYVFIYVLFQICFRFVNVTFSMQGLAAKGSTKNDRVLERRGSESYI